MALTDVEMELPDDPFSGQALRYRKTNRGSVLYSVGADGKDDGGQGTPGVKGPGIVFRLFDLGRRAAATGARQHNGTEKR